MTRRQTPPLVERDAALEAIGQTLRAAAAGSGATLLIEGAPGLGKTEMLAAAAREAPGSGLRVERARGGELEGALAWGVTRELLGRAAKRAERLPPFCAVALGIEDGPPGDPVAVSYGLTELCAELSAAHPIALLVDDVQWADSASLRWLAFMASRVEEHSLALILAARPSGGRRDTAVLLAADNLTVARLEPVTERGAAEIVSRSVGAADEQLARSCWSASGGNLFILVELIREITATGIRDPGAIEALEISSVDRMLARRLDDAGSNARKLARAVAILDKGLLGEAGAVAGLDYQPAMVAADALCGADVLAVREGGEIDFAHPLLRGAMLRSIATGERSLLHLRAAHSMHERRAPVERVGLHLLAVEPGADRWTRDRLVEAGDAAIAIGSPRNASGLYERALAERVDSHDPQLLAKLGRALWPTDPMAAVEPLRAAVDETAEALQRAPLALDLSAALQSAGRAAEGVRVLEELRDQLAQADAPRPLQLEVEAELLAQSYMSSQTRSLRRVRLPEIAQTLTGEFDEEVLVIVQQAVEAINTGTAEEARALASAAWCDGRLEALAGGRSTPTVIWIPYIHMYVDDYEWPIELMLRWIERARRSGSAILASLANGILAEAQWRAGALRDAHASAHAAWRLAEELGPGFPGWPIALGALAQSLLAIGETAQAFELLSSQGWLEGAPSEAMLMPLPRAVRAETLIAAGELDRGAAELSATTSWLQEQGESSPGAWRYPAAHVDALLALGRREEAADKARGWLRRTRRFGTRSTLGMAERAVGLSSGSERQLEWLRRAEKTLAASPARVEHARALVELGAAMRRAGQAKEARDPLRKALDQASRCGAGALVDRARVELATAGGRRRRDALRGADSLTPSERRVAQLAARLTNREIANSLFISPKTVERHLGNIYLKLGTNDRRELAVELE